MTYFRRSSLFLVNVLLLALFLVSLSVPASLAGTSSIESPSVLFETAEILLQGTIAADGPFPRSLSLDGVDSYVRVANHADLNPSSEITIEAWVWRSDANRCETVVGKDFQTSYWLGVCPDTIRFYAAGLGTYVDGNTPIPANEWTHIAVTYDGTTRRYYVNGDLDLETTAGSAPLAANGTDLGIGRDLANTWDENNFLGYLDGVRLWNVVRTQDEIQDNMYEQLLPEAGMVEAWYLNGNSRGAKVRHGGLTVGNADYSYRGVLPAIALVPNSTAAITMDGYCDLGEYGAADRVGLGLVVAYLQHDADNMYICFEGLERVSSSKAVVAIDRDYSHDDPAQSGDYRFTLDNTGVTTAEQGDGAGGYTPFNPPGGSWQTVHALTSEFFWGAEFRFSETLLEIPSWAGSLGLYLAEWGRTSGDMVWPLDADSTLPSTWAWTNLLLTGGSVPTFDFSGHVRRQRDNAGIEGAEVQLLGSRIGGTSFLDAAHTDSTGSYSLSYTGYSPDVFMVQEVDPREVFSISADDGGDGSVSSPNLLLYPGAGESTAYSAGTFVDSDLRLTARNLDRHYLIVYSEDVHVNDLWPLIELKQLQGYQVERITTQEISSTVGGYDLAEKIRNWLIDKWQSYDPEPIYALLIGRYDVLPFRQVGWEGDLAHRTPEHPGFSPALLTEWYYADLDSNWDTDGDGFYGEYVYCAPWESEVPSEPWPIWGEPVQCPPEDSPLREGPYGTDPGTEDDWQAEIAVGRLELNDPAEIRRALETAAASEMSGSLTKRNALVGGAFWSHNGRSWDPEEGQYVDGKGPGISGSWPGEGNQPYGHDTAEHLEVTLVPILNTYMTDVVRLYETTNPYTETVLNPTRFAPDYGLSTVKMAELWQNQGFGLVNVEGHGNDGGVYENYWVNDWNGNRQIDNKADPSESMGCGGEGEPSCWELTAAQAFINNGMPDPAGVAPIVFANACSTADGWADNAIAGRLPSQGKVAIWVGGVGTVPVTGLDSSQDLFSEEILGTPLALGDALWFAVNPDLIGNASDWRRATLQILGDPSLTYWGNPADTMAVWPQSGYDWFSSGSSLFNGPQIGSVAWTTTENSPRSPVAVDRSGNVISGGVGRLSKFAPDGTLIDEVIVDVLPPGLEHLFSPALGTDGIYLASQVRLWVLDLDLNVRDIIPLDHGVAGAPKVGPDGTIWVPTSLGMGRVIPSGVVETVYGGAGANGPVAFDPSGAVLWTATNDALVGYSMDRTGAVMTATVPFVGWGALTSPAVGTDGTSYVGTNSGHVVAVDPFPFDADPEKWNYYSGGTISAKPVVGADGSVYAGNENGMVFALSASGGLLWSQLLEPTAAPAIVADPVADQNRLYVAAGTDLYALSLGTGDILWTIPMGGSLNERSTPVVGGNGILYVTRSDGVLVAVNEDGWLLPASDVMIDPEVAGMVVHWRDNSVGEVGFQVDGCASGGICGSLGTAGADATSLLVSNLPEGEGYYVRVQAVGLAGDGSLQGGGRLDEHISDANYSSGYSYSDWVYILPDLPSAPTSLTAGAYSAEAVSLTWSYGGGDADLLAGFEIYRSNSSGGVYDLVGSVSASTFGYVDGGLDPATTYYYKLVSKNASGSSPEAGPVNATTKSIDLPAPTNFDIDPLRWAMVLTWQDNAMSETGYVVEKWAPGVAWYEELIQLPANTTVYTDILYLYEGQYTYRVKAVAAATESDYAYATELYSPMPAQPYAVYLPVLRK